MDADDLALGSDHEHVMLITHQQHTDHRAVPAACLDVDDAFPGASDEPVLVERRSLAVAASSNREDRHALLRDLGGDDLITVLQVDAAHAGGHAAYRAHLVLGEA